MTRATRNIFDPHIRGARADRNTVISGADTGTGDGDTWWILYVNTICIWTDTRSWKIHILKPSIVAAIKNNMEQLAV